MRSITLGSLMAEHLGQSGDVVERQVDEGAVGPKTMVPAMAAMSASLLGNFAILYSFVVAPCVVL